MSDTTNFLAIDLGASSGRVILGQWDGQRFDLRELHRFPNGPVEVHGHIHWDVLRLWQEITTGIARYAAQDDAPLAGIGIDTWAVDFALLDRAGGLLGNPYHYRDRRTDGMLEIVDQQLARARLYNRTGIQFLPINTLYQLVSMRKRGDPQLDAAATLLLIPDLLHYWLTGRRIAEYTNATTTQFFDARARRWATDLLAELDLPSRILPEVVTPGTVIGTLLPEVRDTAGLHHDVPVIAVGTHDTASAVAAVPGLDQHSVYISSGTWSLVGVEIDQPILSDRARQLNFTNEGGVASTIRFLKNVGGLWLLQECQRQWQRAGQQYSWPELIELAEAAPLLRSLIDPDAQDFLGPNDMPAAIREYCRRTSQIEPESIGAVVRCCLESLALKYRWVVCALEEITGRTLDTICIVGGGSQNALLCQLTADACQRRVVAGPVEATALGNILVQAVALGTLPDIAAGRVAVARSFEQSIYEPHPSADWDTTIESFDALISAAH
ncbi:carbohydrate kinase [Kouleothrix aurantiaca]|uniref:Carbohydrate kinase n=1 Tax=Kouleothrix aurantiaca TaxID=186479 RepID=A0A0P9DHH1_9CHLR|nr:carbohydrate kinase [Kouleothrix aurantiaca]